MNKAFKFRIYPNKEQEIRIAKTMGCVRFVYNKMLSEKVDHYKKTGKTLEITPAKYKLEFEWLKEVDSLALANAQLNLETAYKNFFRDKSVGFPKYKSKHRDKKSYTTNVVNRNIRIEDGKLRLPKVGRVRIKQHREIPENYQLKSVTISQSASGKYHVSLLFSYEERVHPIQASSYLGLDFSMSELYVSSDGASASYPKYYRQAQEKLAREQRKLSKMQKSSQNYRKQRKRLAKRHEKITNQRKDFQHKQSRQIANAYDCVAIEDLNMKALSQTLHFGKSIHDNGWGTFTNYLQYKLTEQGKQLIRIDKWFPSSKTCSACGSKNNELALSERIYICDCGNILDRDLNAAINIRNEAIRLLEVA